MIVKLVCLVFMFLPTLDMYRIKVNLAYCVELLPRYQLVNARQHLERTKLLRRSLVFNCMLCKHHPSVEDNLGYSTNNSVNVLFNNSLLGLELLVLLEYRVSCLLLT